MARRLIPAAQRPVAAGIVAEWLIEEWAHLYPDWAHSAAVAELLDSGHDGHPPCTWLLFEGSDDVETAVLGSIGLSFGGELEPSADAEALVPDGIWVVNLFVTPAARGHGHGTALLAHAVEHATTLGIGTLLLTTEHSAMHYRSLGWVDIGTAELNGHRSTNMRLALGTGSAMAR